MNLNVEDQIAKLEEKDTAKEQAGREMYSALMQVAMVMSGTGRDMIEKIVDRAHKAGWDLPESREMSHGS